MSSSRLPKKSLTALAEEVLANAKAIDEYFEKSGENYPSLEELRDADANLNDAPGAVQAARVNLLSKNMELRELLTDPMDSVVFLCLPELYPLGALQVLCEFEVPQNVPLKGSISYSDLAEKTKFNQVTLARCVRLVMTKYFFTEPEPGFVTHSARSHFLATNEAARACLSIRKHLELQGASKFAEFLAKHAQDPEPKETAMQLALGEDYWEFLGKRPEMGAKFGLLMQAVSTGKNQIIDSDVAVANAYPFGEHQGKLIVDVGGGTGHISAAIAKAHPGVNFLVEDRAENASEAEKVISESGLSSQVQFLGHDFFQPQPESARHAAIYFFRNVLHNWPDSSSRKVLKNIVDVMDESSKLMICDWVLPAPGTVPKFVDSMERTMDAMQWVDHGSRERSLDEWIGLLESVDKRLQISQVIGPRKMRRQRLLVVTLQR